MTTQLTSKFSLYDILSMVLPGCIWLWIIKKFLPIVEEMIPFLFSKMDTFWGGMLFISIGYVVGVIANMFTGYLWRKSYQNKDSRYDKIIKQLNSEGCRNFDAIPGACAKEKFMYANEYVRQNSAYYTIPVVESQVAMLRNLILPFAISTFICMQNHLSLLLTIFASILIGVIMVYCTHKRQYRQYKLVLMDYEYMQRLSTNLAKDNHVWVNYLKI